MIAVDIDAALAFEMQTLARSPMPERAQHQPFGDVVGHNHAENHGDQQIRVGLKQSHALPPLLLVATGGFDPVGASAYNLPALPLDQAELHGLPEPTGKRQLDQGSPAVGLEADALDNGGSIRTRRELVRPCRLKVGPLSP